MTIFYILRWLSMVAAIVFSYQLTNPNEIKMKIIIIIIMIIIIIIINK